MNLGIELLCYNVSLKSPRIIQFDFSLCLGINSLSRFIGVLVITRYFSILRISFFDPMDEWTNHSQR